jgi:aspartyl-tRNA synthetase
VRNEFVLRVTGLVRRRPEGTVNTELKSGEIEVLAHEIEVLNSSATPPFMMDDEQISEEVRLKYRFLDLRRPAMQRIMRMRHATARAVREYLDDNGFVDVETPVLYKSTPEGAREFLVPSRIHDGQFYALPQSPQLFKQLLMVAGYDRYYQIVKCFRDEDLRADRQPEFTQIDIETSFLDEREIQDIMEGLMPPRVEARARRGPRAVPAPHLCRGHVEVRQRQARPAREARAHRAHRRRARLRLQGVQVGRRPPDGRVAALRVPGGNEQFTRKELDDLTPFVAIYGRKGLAYIRVNDPAKLNEEGLQSPIVKFLSPKFSAASSSAPGALAGDVIFFGADRRKVVNDALGALAAEAGATRRAMPRRASGPAGCSTSRRSSTTTSTSAGTRPTTRSRAPRTSTSTCCRATRQGAAKAYDIAMNGWELGGGSVRIHRADVQAKQFAALGISPEDQRAKFGFLLDALAFGAPPHGGIAFGLDRMVAMLAGVEQIRDVIAFPKTQRGQDMMVETPTPVTEKQLRELHIRLRNKE